MTVRILGLGLVIASISVGPALAQNDISRLGNIIRQGAAETEWRNQQLQRENDLQQELNMQRQQLPQYQQESKGDDDE